MTVRCHARPWSLGLLPVLASAWLVAGFAAAEAGAAPSLEDLAKRLDAKSADERIAAARALADRAPDVVPVLPQLAKALKNEYWDVRTSAMYALGQVGPEAVPILVKTLGDRHYWARLYACRALGRIGAEAEAAVEPLGKLLADEAVDIREEAARALAAIGTVGPVVPGLVAALQDPFQRVRGAAVAALGKADASSAPRLVPLLAHEDGSVRQAATAALGRMGEAAAEVAVEPLVARLVAAAKETTATYGSIESEGIRNSRIGHAVRDSREVDALAAMGPKAAGPVAALLEGADPVLTQYVIRTLGGLGEDAREAVPALLAYVKGETDPWQQARAASTLAAAGKGDERVLTLLVKLLDSPEDPPRRYAAYALSGFGPDGVHHLVAAARAGKPTRRIAACQGLAYGSVGGPEVVEVLRAAVKDDHEGVREAAEAALVKAPK